MARPKKSSEEVQMMRPGLTPESREQQVVSLAIDLAEKQIREGTASSQVITHFLKIGSTKERLEKEIMEKQMELISAKAEAIRSGPKTDKLYEEAIKAMRKYSGHGNEDD